MKKKISTKTVWAKFLCLCKRTPPNTFAENGGKFSELISQQITSNFNNNSDQQKEIIGPKVSDRKSEWNNKIRTMTSLLNVRDPHRPSTIPVTSQYMLMDDCAYANCTYKHSVTFHLRINISINITAKNTVAVKTVKNIIGCQYCKKLPL